MSRRGELDWRCSRCRSPTEARLGVDMGGHLYLEALLEHATPCGQKCERRPGGALDHAVECGVCRARVRAEAGGLEQLEDGTWIRSDTGEVVEAGA